MDDKGPSNPNDVQCYCSGKRELGTVELQCMTCLKWFHQRCLTNEIGPAVPFMNAYAFNCRQCSQTGYEGCIKKQATFIQMCQTVLANLIFQSRDNEEPVRHFSKDREIIPFMDANWEALTVAPRRVKSTWHATVVKTLTANPSLFDCEVDPETGATLFGMHDHDFSLIAPNYDALRAQGLIKDTPASANRLKNMKRRQGGSGVNGADRRPRLPAHGYPADHPFNKDEWRYIFAESDPNASQEDDPNEDTAQPQPLPPHQYRRALPNSVMLSMHDRAPILKITADRLGVTGEKGYCLVRSTHSVSGGGSWYLEVSVTSMPDNSAVRIGFGSECANLQAPLGYDAFGYSYRSRKGTKFHRSIGKHYGEGYTEGDVIGMMLHLPSRKVALHPTHKDKPLVKFKGFLYYEVRCDKIKEEKRIQSSHSTDNRIEFFKNGVSQGIAFENIPHAPYFPTISLYKQASVKVNFGPDFTYPPHGRWKPYCAREHENVCEQVLSDLLYLIETDNAI